MDRECRRCHDQYPIDRFHRSKGYICRQCRTKYEVARRRELLRFAPLPQTDADEQPSSESSLEDASEAGEQQECHEAGEEESSGDELLEEEEDPAHLGALYVMENSRIPSELKVGRSRNPFKRARQLACCHNFEMRLLAIYPRAGHLEKFVHCILAPHRVPGHSREFFRVSRKRAFSAVSQAMAEFE
jgi:hypothetical protein